MTDPVNHPDHYGGEDNPYETIKVIEATGHPSEVIGFLKWNAYKYLSRLGQKKDSIIQDAGKAAWYANRLVEFLKRLNDSERNLVKEETAIEPVMKMEVPEEFASGAVLDVHGHRFTDRNGIPMCEVCFVGYYVWRNNGMPSCQSPPCHKWNNAIPHSRAYCENCGTLLKEYAPKTGMPQCIPAKRGEKDVGPQS